MLKISESRRRTMRWNEWMARPCVGGTGCGWLTWRVIRVSWCSSGCLVYAGIRHLRVVCPAQWRVKRMNTTRRGRVWGGRGVSICVLPHSNWLCGVCEVATTRTRLSTTIHSLRNYDAPQMWFWFKSGQIGKICVRKVSCKVKFLPRIGPRLCYVGRICLFH